MRAARSVFRLAVHRTAYAAFPKSSPYEVTALIGEGGVGKVGRAHLKGLKGHDALNVLPDITPHLQGLAGDESDLGALMP